MSLHVFSSCTYWGCSGRFLSLVSPYVVLGSCVGVPDRAPCTFVFNEDNGIFYVWFMVQKGVADEERMLVKKSGAGYETYREEVKRYIPFVW